MLTGSSTETTAPLLREPHGPFPTTYCCLVGSFRAKFQADSSGKKPTF
jgi:hypothetical protein